MIFFLLGESDVLLAADSCKGFGGLEGGQQEHLHASERFTSGGCFGSPLAGFGRIFTCETGGLFGLFGGMGGCDGAGVAVIVRGRSYRHDSPPPGGAGAGVTNRGTEYSEFPLLPPLPCDDRDMRSQLAFARGWRCWGWWAW